MQEAVIVSAVRTAVGKAPNGMLRGTRPDELAATVIQEALRRAPAVEPAEVDDVILGCAMPEGEQGMNVARIAALRAGLPVETSAMTVNRFCSSGLQAIALGAERIRGRRNIQESRFAQPNRKSFTVRRILGGADVWVTEFVLTYDGRPSYTVSIMEFSDGKVARETQYFADPFEPGPSRAHAQRSRARPGAAGRGHAGLPSLR